jgi:23S rRNA G2445 N2-methylase RlmL
MSKFQSDELQERRATSGQRLQIEGVDVDEDEVEPANENALWVDVKENIQTARERFRRIIGACRPAYKFDVKAI